MVSIMTSEKDHLRGRQIAAARALIGMAQADLAAAAKISVPTLRRMESGDGPASGFPNNVAAVQRALEAEGILFVHENGEGPGVRLRKAQRGTSDGQ